MVYDPEQQRRNDAVDAEHKQALAAGEKRVLRTTATGELYSYAGDEIGFTSGPGQAQVSRPEEELIYRRSENGEMVGYTSAEYGVRKDDGGGLVKPLNSSAGLLFLAVLLTACVGGLVYGVIQVALTDQWHILGSVWWVFPACLFPFLAAWAGYLKERKAEKLRKARNLSRPLE